MRRNLFLITMSLGLSSPAFSAVPDYAGCAEQDYVTLAGPSVTIEVQGSGYSPACLKIKKGTEVTIPASKKHPLQGARDFGGVANPITSNEGEHLRDQVVSLNDVGFYGYYCTKHGDAESGDGMAGMIWVVE
jgi:plastocyanin